MDNDCDKITEDISKIKNSHSNSNVKPMGYYGYEKYDIDYNNEDKFDPSDIENISNERYYLSVNQDNKVNLENFGEKNNIEHFKNTKNKNKNISFNDILLILVIIILSIIIVNYFFTLCICGNNDNKYFSSSSSSSSSSSPFDNF